MLVLTFMVLASPFASAQTDIAATPDAEVPIETPVVEETPIVETTPEVTQAPDVIAPQPEGDVTPETGDEVLPPATTPESTPTTQSRAGDVELMATRFIEIDLLTSDSAAVPDGTEVCFYNSEEGCQIWEGETLTFSPFTRNAEFYVSTPSGSGYAPAQGMFIVPTGPATVQTIVLEREATVAISLEGAGGVDAPVGTEVCLDTSEEGCQYWNGEPLDFTVVPGTVEYLVTPPSDSGFGILSGLFTVSAGASVEQVITLDAEATFSVTVVTADGQPLPDWVDVNVDDSRESWGDYEGTPLTFTVTPGPVEWDVYLPWDSRYQEASGTVTVASDGSTELVIELQPKALGTLRVYLSTDQRQPAPAGTRVCVDMPEPEFGDPVENLCQSLSGDSVSFPLQSGWATVTVTPLLGSGYHGGSWEYRVELGETTRVWVELESTEQAYNATLAFNISMSDGSPVGDSGMVCLIPGSADNLFLEVIDTDGCIYPSEGEENPDGSSVTVFFNVVAGDYSYIAVVSDGTSWTQGTVTAVSNAVTTVDVVLPVPTGEIATAVVNVNVETLVGEQVPAGTLACVASIAQVGGIEDYCELWTGTPISFEVQAGPIVVVAMPPEDSDYRPGLGSIYKIVEGGQTYDETVLLYPYEFETGIEMTVSDEAPQSGDTVTYTIRAYGAEPMWGLMAESDYAYVDFEITDVLPDELSNITISCGGTYFPAVPSGTCYDLDGNNLSVFGGYWLTGVFDVTVTITGTITGDPGTEVTNTAYVSSQWYREEVNSTDLDVNMVASTSLSGMLFQGAPVPDLPSASATLVIAGQVPVDPTPTPDPTETPAPGETPTPDPTEAPIDPTPAPSETPAPGETETPAPGETPATGETPTATEATTPGAVTGLPSTGTGTGGGSLAILAGLGAALAALGAGLVVRTYRTRA